MPPSARERGQGSCRGAVVIGLGPMGDLSSMALTEAVRVGTLRYLLQLLARGDGGAGRAREVGLASLLIGQNSTNTITIEECVMALVEGVLAANAQFANTVAGVAPQVGHLRLVELHLDTAITATRALARARGRSRTDPCPAGALLARRLEAIGHALRESEAATAPPAAEGDSGEGDAGKGADVIERSS